MTTLRVMEVELSIDGNLFNAIVKHYYSPAESSVGESGPALSAQTLYAGAGEELEITETLLEVGNDVWAILPPRYFPRLYEQVLKHIHEAE